jgi:hypothetical protein
MKRPLKNNHYLLKGNDYSQAHEIASLNYFLMVSSTSPIK